MKLSEVFDTPVDLESKFRRIVDGPEPLQEAVEEAAGSPEDRRSRHESLRNSLEEAGEEVIHRTNLGEIFSDHKLYRVSRNGRKEFREYLLDYGKFGILFDFRNDKATTHT